MSDKHERWKHESKQVSVRVISLVRTHGVGGGGGGVGQGQ